MWKCSIRYGEIDATDWNWNPITVRAKVRTARMSHRSCIASFLRDDGRISKKQRLVALSGRVETIVVTSANGTSATSRGDLRMSACRAQTGPAAEMVGGPNLTRRRHRLPKFAVMHNAAFPSTAW